MDSSSIERGLSWLILMGNNESLIRGNDSLVTDNSLDKGIMSNNSKEENDDN